MRKIWQFIDESKNMVPKAWSLIDEKIFKNTERFHDHRYIYLEYASCIGLITKEISTKRSNYDKATVTETYIQWLTQRENQMPIFFVENKLLEAALMTDFKHQVEWWKIPFPFSSFNFVLEKNNNLSVRGKDVAIISVTRLLKPEIEATKKIAGDVFDKEFDQIIQFCVQTTGMEKYVSHLLHAWNPESPCKAKIPAPYQPLDNEEKDMLKRLPGIVFSLIFAMNARPELIERGRKVGTHKKSKSEIWEPNIIGRKYRIKTDGSGDGTGSSKRMHWRRGHYRLQPFGPGRSETKTIWLEPMLVGLKNEALV